MNQPRTVSEICIDLDNNQHNEARLREIDWEIMANKKKYALVEVEFMQEHLVKYKTALETSKK